MPANFWDFAQHFHEKVHKGYPSGMAGLAAFFKVRKVFEQNWQEAHQHPLRSKILVASEPNYEWIIHFARKLDELRTIPESDVVIARLGSPREYPGAWGEIDFALRLHLSGVPCRFVPRSEEPAPDLQTELQGRSVEVEITSLNPSELESIWLGAFSSILNIAFRERCVAGGVVGRVPNRTEATGMVTRVEKAAKEANETKNVVTVNIPGLFTCYIVPEDIVSQMPSKWIGHFEMRTRTPTPKKDRLAQIIAEKAKSQLSHSKSSVLVVYDRFSSAEEMRQLFDNYDIPILVGTFPSLAGVVLVHPFLSFDPLKPAREDKYGTTYIEQSLPDGEAERCVIWGNPIADHKGMTERTICCLTDFPANLSRMFSSDLPEVPL